MPRLETIISHLKKLADETPLDPSATSALLREQIANLTRIESELKTSTEILADAVVEDDFDSMSFSELRDKAEKVSAALDKIEEVL